MAFPGCNFILLGSFGGFLPYDGETNARKYLLKLNYYLVVILSSGILWRLNSSVFLVASAA